MATKEDLIDVGFDRLNPVPLMFQTGYLSIKSYDPVSQFYSLGFPNKEVETGFYRSLLRVYVPETRRGGGRFEFTRFKTDLINGKVNDFMQRLATLLKDLPGEDHSESTYRAVTYLLTELCDTNVVAEHHGYKGRSDIEVISGEYVYIFEFKYNIRV